MHMVAYLTGQHAVKQSVYWDNTVLSEHPVPSAPCVSSTAIRTPNKVYCDFNQESNCLHVYSTWYSLSRVAHSATAP